VKQVQHIMDKYLMKRRAFFLVKALVTSTFMSVALSACVTQKFENGETPVVQNQANRNDMAVTRISLGLGYLKMGNMPQAKQNLEKAKKFAPEMVQVHTAFAHYYEVVGEQQLTVESYEKALSIKSDDADTLNNYGVYLCRQGQLENAEKQFLKAIAVPSYLLVAKSYENLTLCFLKEDHFDKAEMYLNKAIMHSPSSASTLFQMVRLQYAMGEYQQAKLFEQRFEKVTHRFTPESLALAFKVYTKLDQKRIAKNYGAMLVKMYPQSWEAQQYLLNELELIDADNLAKRYELTEVDDQKNKPKKRVIRLSPNKKSPNKKVPNNNFAGKKMPVASTQMINAALSMAPITEQSVLDSDVLEIPATAEAVIATAAQMKVIDHTIQETEVKKLAHQEDREIFNVAKKSVPIINTPVEIESGLIAVKLLSKEPTVKVPAIHLVGKGDTLYSISVKYNVKIKALRRWNKISVKKKIKINDKLFIENPENTIAVTQVNG